MGCWEIDNVLVKASEWIPARVALSVMTFLGCINLYMVRVNLSVSIVAMVRPDFTSQTVDGSPECVPYSKDPLANQSLSRLIESDEAVVLLSSDSYVENTTRVLVREMEGELDWNEMIQGMVLASFFYGYTLTQVIGGRLAEKYGTKLLFGICILAGGISAVLTPMAARTHYGVLIALRILQGIMQGVAWPSLHMLVVRWIPPLERGKFIAFVYNASAISTTMTLPLCGVIIDSYGWPASFYITGCLSLIWCFYWFLFMYDYPDDHPRISLEEKKFIETAIRLSGTSDVPPSTVPWKKMALSMPVWANLVCDIGNSFGFSLCITHIPTYMKNILGFSIKENGFLSAAPFLSRYCGGILASTIGDWMLSRRLISILSNRRMFSAIAMFGPAVMVIGVSYSGCNPTAAVVFLCLAMFLNGAISTSLFVNHCDIAPNFSGTLMGITNTGASVMAFVAPTVAGALTNNQQTQAQWQKLFWLCVPIYSLTEIFFLMFVSGTVQDWNYVDPQLGNGSQELTSKYADRTSASKLLDAPLTSAVTTTVSVSSNAGVNSPVENVVVVSVDSGGVPV